MQFCVFYAKENRNSRSHKHLNWQWKIQPERPLVQAAQHKRPRNVTWLDCIWFILFYYLSTNSCLWTWVVSNVTRARLKPTAVRCVPFGELKISGLNHSATGARALKFHIRISQEKTADHNFFLACVMSLSGVMSLWKKLEWNIVSKISQKVFELGAWNLVRW